MLRNQQTVARNTYSRVKYHFSSFNNFLFPCWWIESSRRTNDGPSSITDRSPSRITQPVKLRRENSDVDAPSRRGMTCTFCAHYSGFKIFELFIHNKNISCWSFTQRWLLTPVSIIIVCYDDDEMKRESKVVYIPSGLLAHVYNLFLFLFLGFFSSSIQMKRKWRWNGKWSLWGKWSPVERCRARKVLLHPGSFLNLPLFDTKKNTHNGERGNKG